MRGLRHEGGGDFARFWPAVLAAVVTLAGVMPGVLEPIDLLLQDAFLRLLPRRSAAITAAVLIDEDSLERQGPWPWERSRLATLVTRIRGAGARGVVLDILLPEKRPLDEDLAAALDRVPSVLAAGIDERGNWILPSRPLRGLVLGHVSFEADRDGVVRRFFSTKQLGKRSLPALAVAAARIVEPALPIPAGVVIRPDFRSVDAPVVSATLLLEGRAPESQLRGRIVFVGASAAGIGDRFVSPVSRTGPEAGVLVQLASCESVLARELLRPAAPFWAGLVAAGAAALAILLRGRAWAFGIPFLPFVIGGLLLAAAGVEIPMVVAGVSVLAVTVFLEVDATRRHRRETQAAARRVEDLQALASALEAGRREEAEARRVVAHELKTPLTSVHGLAQLLADFDLSEDERRRVAGMVVSETSRLSRMVEALLDLERLKLRRFSEHARKVNFSQLVEDRVAVLGRAGERVVEAAIRPGIHVLGDAELLGRVIDNLISNAFKFSDAGSRVDVRLTGTHDGLIWLEVADQGPGIAPLEREKVFRRFTRGEASETIPGLGLGLALVAETVVWHRGTVVVEPNPGGGSLFRVVLPAAAPVLHRGSKERA